MPHEPGPARLLELYPSTAALPEALRAAALAQEARPLSVPSGAVLFDEGSPCQGFPFVLAGEVRIARGAPNGRSLELYRVRPGEFCVVSASCLFGRHAMPAYGQATMATELMLLSPAGFERWTADVAFRRHVFGIFADRLTDLMALAEAVAFQRLDQRLAALLLAQGPVLRLTHQALADELGTVREIVTRLLRRFAEAGQVSLGRERIEVLDDAALRALAAGQPATPSLEPCGTSSAG